MKSTVHKEVLVNDVQLCLVFGFSLPCTCSRFFNPRICCEQLRRAGVGAFWPRTIFCGERNVWKQVSEASVPMFKRRENQISNFSISQKYGMVNYNFTSNEIAVLQISASQIKAVLSCTCNFLFHTLVEKGIGTKGCWGQEKREILEIRSKLDVGQDSQQKVEKSSHQMRFF